MLSNEVRSTFLNYFKRNGHEILASSSLIPHGDKTILFTNAGMNQFKNAFLGLEKRAYVRAATAQKVMRVSGKHNDLENIGDTKRHHTFFEMLGNFSFGDYFKADAMHFALELLEKEYGFERDRMWFTIYKDDDESMELWQKVGIKASRVLKFGEKDNFWSMGATGPCGPNSEIHYFTGKIADNDARFVNNDEDASEVTAEIWNLVFMQYNRTEDGVLHPLPQTGVDTGMGFERLVRLLQSGDSNYDTDLFLPLIARTQELARQSDAQREAHRKAYRVIADHARAAAFLIGDGVLPGNEGRNYVLRMIMRRAMRFGLELGLEDPFLFEVGNAVVDKMGDVYPDLKNRRQHIATTIHQEEERFARTLDIGLDRLQVEIATVKLDASGSPHINGAAAFKLYDTYGLPIEITRDIAKEQGLSVDDAGFEQARNESKNVARKAGQGRFEGHGEIALAYKDAYESLQTDGKLGTTGVAYDPYGPSRVSTVVVAILRDGEMTDRAVMGETVDVVVAATSMYVEGGGQQGDTGVIAGDLSGLDVERAWRPLPGLVVHTGKIHAGQLQVGDAVTVTVDRQRRAAIQRNHTATHLLQESLRSVLGNHVGQQGSLVAPDRLRFDFSHGAPMSRAEQEAVMERVNGYVLRDLAVWDQQENYKDAVADGAMAFFSEKYGDVVRVVRIGDHDASAGTDSVISAELCGGTHVRSTGEIGSAVILGESAVAAGIRRLEVATGLAALEVARRQQRALQDVAQALGAPIDAVAEKAGKLVEDLAASQKQLLTARRELAQVKFDHTLAGVVRGHETVVLVARVDATDADLLRDMTDWFRSAHASGVAVLGAVIADKPSLVITVSPDLNKRGLDAGKLIREIARIVGGGGGGKPTLAQAGGKDAAKLDDALSHARELVTLALQ